MILTLMEGTLAHQLTLPDSPEGLYPLEDPQGGQPILKIIAQDNAWTVEPGTGWTVHSNGKQKLEDNMLLKLSYAGGQRRALLFCEEMTDDRVQYIRVSVPAGTVIRFGGSPKCEISTTSAWFDAHHLTFTMSASRQWTAECMSPFNNMFINGRAAHKASLYPGDAIWCLGQKFIFLPGILAFNNPCGNLIFSTKIPMLDHPHIERKDFYRVPKEPAWFNRRPRFIDDLDTGRIDLDAPPVQQKYDAQSPLLTIGPALTSGLFMLMGGMSSVMGLGMMASNLIFPSIGRKKAQEKQEEYEARRQEAYKAYLQEQEIKLDDMVNQQTCFLRQASPSIGTLAERLISDQRGLWDHKPTDKDHLLLRIGTGNVPLKCELNAPQEHFDLNDDALREMMFNLKNKERQLIDVPIKLDLNKYSVCGITGDQSSVSVMTANLLMQLTLQYGYDELKLCILGQPYETLKPFCRLPHTWDDTHTEHLVSWDENELALMMPLLAKQLTKRLDDGNPLPKGEQPVELVILIPDSRIARKGAIARLLFSRDYRNVRIITLAEHSHELPRQCTVLMAVKGKKAIMRANNERMDFRPDTSIVPMVPKLVQMMENTFLDLPSANAMLPSVVPFLSLYGTEDVASLNVLSRWHRSNPTRTLAAPIGITEDGTICMLDVHEAIHGPHGLIVGMTGSGKSELIMSYILSLAVNFSPNEVAFLLIDYKGGGMATAMRELPHVAGIMTNLDGNMIQRAMKAVRSELRRRQQLFHEAEMTLGVSNMNINRYQVCVRSGQIQTPLPHLLIITDEFAELKSQEPEFMRELISASRIGRSLGVHLILSTQKPSGVVDDQIWSNTSWQICLRVQSTSDSNDVLHSPVASELTQVGRFFMQTGSGTMTKAQSGWTGAPYTPDSFQLPECHVDVLDRTGFVVQQADLGHELRGKSRGTQMEAILAHLKLLAKPVRKLWLPPLEEKLSLQMLRKRYAFSPKVWEMSALIAEADDPERQRRLPILLDLGSGQNTVVYGTTGAGKSMLIATLLQGMLLDHDPQEINFYILDYLGDGLSACKGAPQVADVLTGQGDADEEKFQRLLLMLQREITARRALMSGIGKDGELSATLRKAGLPHIVLIVHDIQILKERLNDEVNTFARILNEGVSLGISCIATATATGFGFKLEQAFAERVVLQMAHTDDYAYLLGRTGGMCPAAIRGRGLMLCDKELLEFQLATPDLTLEQLAEESLRRWPGQGAKPIGLMPRIVSIEELVLYGDAAHPMRVPVALRHTDLAPCYMELDSRPVHQVLGHSGNSMRFMCALAKMFHQSNPDTAIIIMDSSGICSDVLGAQIFRGKQEQADYIDRFFAELMEIQNGKRSFSPQLILIPDIPRTLSVLEDIIITQDDAEDTASQLLTNILSSVKPNWLTTFVLGGTAAEMQKLSYSTPWYDAKCSEMDGLMLGGKLNDQSVFKLNQGFIGMVPNRIYPDGYIIAGGEMQYVRFIGDEKGDS